MVVIELGLYYIFREMLAVKQWAIMVHRHINIYYYMYFVLLFRSHRTLPKRILDFLRLFHFYMLLFSVRYLFINIRNF